MAIKKLFNVKFSFLSNRIRNIFIHESILIKRLAYEKNGVGR